MAEARLDRVRAALNSATEATPEKGWPRWAATFLAAFRDKGTISAACTIAGVERSTAYRLRQRDEAFALAWSDVESETTDEMEREAYRRAVQGVEKPVYHKGELIDTVWEYSDTLLIFMLKARKPDVYRENVRLEHAGRIEHTTPEIPDDEERRREVEALLRGAGV